jgi:hypothetical protein
MSEDNFKKFVQQHREEFDDELPCEQIWAGIEKQLRPPPRFSVVRMVNAPFLKVAALIVLLIGLTWIILLMQFRSGAASTSIVTPGLQQAEEYYSHEINKRLIALKAIPENKLQLPEGTWQMLKINTPAYEQLQNDLAANPGDNRIQAAFIQYYRCKLDLIEKIENTYSQTQNNDKNEKAL